jgi:hypothetical protein
MTSTLTPPTIVGAARDTATMALHVEPRTDTLSFLDHRSLGRMVRRDLASAGHYLELRNEHDEPYVMPLERSVLHVGRAIAADMRIEDAHVSRRHAIIVRHGANARVLDDRSSTGTFVNGHRVLTSDLHDGDVVRLGRVAMRYIVLP